jgi:predicted transcriptional regulator of viral defense system
MQTLTKELLKKGLANRPLADTELKWLLQGSAQRRHNLVNRALRAGELIRLRRGHYVVSDEYRDHRVHPFALAQSFVPGSYVSFETALAHHGWIPETVHVTASVTPGRKSSTAEHAIFGIFSFHPLATQRGHVLQLVERLQIERQTMLVAKPVRALMDLVCLRKIQWQGMDWIVDGLRIDLETLHSVPPAEFSVLASVYKQKRVQSFLDALRKEVGP